MIIFPITRRPITPWDSEREDNVIRSPMEAGYETTRPRYTKVRDNLGPFTWQYLTDADYQTLMNFYGANCALIFQFSVSTRTRTITKNVRFAAPPKASYVGMDKWLVQCTFREA